MAVVAIIYQPPPQNVSRSTSCKVVSCLGRHKNKGKGRSRLKIKKHYYQIQEQEFERKMQESNSEKVYRSSRIKYNVKLENIDCQC